VRNVFAQKEKFSKNFDFSLSAPWNYMETAPPLRPPALYINKV